MKTTIAVGGIVATAAVRLAEREKRNVANVCSAAVVEYCAARSAGEINAAVLAAAQQLGPRRALELLARSARRRAARRAIERG